MLKVHALVQPGADTLAGEENAHLREGSEHTHTHTLSITETHAHLCVGITEVLNLFDDLHVDGWLMPD